MPWFFAFRTPVCIGDLRGEYSFDFLRERMGLVECAADEQFFDLSVDQGFECLVQPDYCQSPKLVGPMGTGADVVPSPSLDQAREFIRASKAENTLRAPRTMRKIPASHSDSRGGCSRLSKRV